MIYERKHFKNFSHAPQSWKTLTEGQTNQTIALERTVVFEFEGPGFTFAGPKTLVEDLCIMFPVER